MAHQPPPGLLGIHVNMPAVVPEDIATVLSNGDPAPSGLSSAEKDAFASLEAFYRKGAGSAAIMNTRPQTLATGWRIRRPAWLPLTTRDGLSRRQLGPWITDAPEVERNFRALN
jgi:hypothetical protein